MLDRPAALRMLFLIPRIDFKQTATGAHMPCGRRFFAGHGFARGYFDSWVYRFYPAGQKRYTGD
jgi:hypothetical protein